jgi:hypothetical protein
VGHGEDVIEPLATRNGEEASGGSKFFQRMNPRGGRIRTRAEATAAMAGHLLWPGGGGAEDRRHEDAA